MDLLPDICGLENEVAAALVQREPVFQDESDIKLKAKWVMAIDKTLSYGIYKSHSPVTS